MITDNPIHPKVYEVTKLMDTFPLGCQKIVLAQAHYNEHTDLCESVDLTGNGIPNLDDLNMHYICDYYKSSIVPSKEEIKEDIEDEIIPNEPTETPIVTWSLNKNINDKLYVHGNPQTVQAVPNVDTDTHCEWHILIDNEEIISNLDDSYEDKTAEFIDDYNNEVEHPYLESYLDISIDNENNSLTIAAINKDFAGYTVKIKVYDKEYSYNDFIEMEVRI